MKRQRFDEMIGDLLKQSAKTRKATLATHRRVLHKRLRPRPIPPPQRYPKIERRPPTCIVQLRVRIPR